jgi:hypothetical protein
MRLPIFQTTVLAAALISCAVFLQAQAPPIPQQPTDAVGAESSSKQVQNRSGHANDFLVRGTVFTPEGLALPGAELHIRRTSERKFRWNDAANSRGEFAIRVKMGADYEVVAHAKGYEDQSVPVKASTGERFKDVVFHMQRRTGKKS